MILKGEKNRRFYLFRLSCALLILISPVHVCHAQVLGLNDAVTGAINNYPLIQQRNAEIKAGQAHIVTARSQRLPNLTLQDQWDMGTLNKLPGTYLTYGMVPSIPGGNTSTYVQNDDLNMNNVAVAFFQWNVYNFGYYHSLVNEARKQLSINEANLGSDKYSITQHVISLYLDWLKKYRLLQINNENMQRTEVVLTSIRATVNSGLKPGVDSSTASATYADARINYLQSLDDYNSDQIAIGSFSGLNTGSLSPDTSFVEYALHQGLSGSSRDSVPTDHPLLSVYVKQYEAQLADIQTISRKYMPHLGLEGVSWLNSSGIPSAGNYPNDPFYGMPYSKSNYMFGATVTYNLFDLKHRQAEMMEGKYEAEARKSAMQTEQVTLNTMLQQANSTYASTIEKLNEVPIEVSSARQAYGQQLALYRAGLNTLIDLTNAQYVLLQAETNDVLLQDQLLQVMFIRAGLTGQLDNFLQKAKR